MSFSSDGRWWWDGRGWMAAVSADGRWRWDGTAWVPSSGRTGQSGWLRAIFGLGPILGGLVTGALFFFATRDLSISFQRAALTWAGLATMRLLDPLLAPFWRLLGKVPGILRLAVALVVVGWYSINLGPAAFGSEVDHFQPALYLSIAVAYVLLRPSRGGYAAPA